MASAFNTRLPVLLLTLSVALAGTLAFRHNPLTNAAQDYARTIASASAGVYITLRTLNAALSIAQEVEVGGSLVVSGTMQPLKGLEPIDDTIERIAGAVFALMLITGVLAVAMGPVGAVGWVLVTLACLMLLFGRRRHGAGLDRRLLSYGAFFALALPASFVLASFVADWMTASVWAEHSAIVDDITGSVGVADPAVEESWLGGLEKYRAIASGIYARADELIASYVALLSVFVFKLLVLPALLAGGFFVAARHLARQPGQAPPA